MNRSSRTVQLFGAEMTPDQVRAKLHRRVSAGDFDDLNECRGTLHQLVNEWVDWAEVQYESERSHERCGMAPPATIQAPVAFKVIGSVFYKALVSETPPGVAVIDQSEYAKYLQGLNALKEVGAGFVELMKYHAEHRPKALGPHQEPYLEE